MIRCPLHWILWPRSASANAAFRCPARTGRVDLLRKMTNALASDDELEVCVLLMAERPEEIHE